MSPPEAVGTIWSQGGGTAPGPGVSPLPHQAQTECSRGECTPCWQADGDPKTQDGFWLHLVEALALGEKEKIGKVPCIPSVPGSCLLLTASPPCWPWDDKGGEDQKGERSCDSYPMPPSLLFLYVSWKTNCSQLCELKDPHELWKYNSSLSYSNLFWLYEVLLQSIFIDFYLFVYYNKQQLQKTKTAGV